MVEKKMTSNTGCSAKKTEGTALGTYFSVVYLARELLL
jgi:hypothetical protein